MLYSMQPESSNQQPINNVEKNSLNSILFSEHLQRFSDDFCKLVIDCAPRAVQQEANYLSSPLPQEYNIPKKMILYGPSGSGKTTLARVIAQGICKPYLIIRGSVIANEYQNSGASGLLRAIAVALKTNATVIIDEMDCVAKKSKKNNSSDSDDKTPEALWQLLDDIERNNMLFIGTTNNIANMPIPLQERLKACLYKIPLLDHELDRKKIIESAFKKFPKVITEENCIEFFSKKTAGFSNRDLITLASSALKLAYLRNPDSIVINQEDFQTSYIRIKEGEKIIQKTEWDKKEIFNYTIQTIGAIANIVSIINTIRSLNWARLSYLCQQSSLDIQKEGLQKQEKGIYLQTEGLAHQKIGLEKQEKSIQLQKESAVRADIRALAALDLQQAGLLNSQRTHAFQVNTQAFNMASKGK